MIKNIPEEDFEIAEGDQTIKVHYIGTGEIEYGVPEWTEGDNPEFEPYVELKGEKYWLSEFLRFDNKEGSLASRFDGYMTTTNTGGDVMVLTESGDGAAVYSVWS